MAKKKTKTTSSSTVRKTCKPSAGKAAAHKVAKKSPKQHDHHDAPEEEIELDESENAAIDLVLDRDELRNALETEVNNVVTQAVRKLCKAHGAVLTVAQAQNVAMVLFGD